MKGVKMDDKQDKQWQPTPDEDKKEDAPTEELTEVDLNQAVGGVIKSPTVSGTAMPSIKLPPREEVRKTE